MCGSLHREGDEGQRYEVQAQRRDGENWDVIGWTNDETGGSLAEGARLWPRYQDVRVIDRTGEAKS